MKRPIQLVIAAIFSLGVGVGVYNYTQEDIVLIDVTDNGFVCDTLTISKTEITRSLTKEYRSRDINKPLNLYIHHTVTSKYATADQIAKIHVDGNKWAGIGYHIGINYKGDVMLLNSLETLSYHTRGNNTAGIAIVLIGNYEVDVPSEKMIKSLEVVVNSLESSLNIVSVMPHLKAKGAATLCPGKNTIKKAKYLFR